MPRTSKGQKVLSQLTSQYGPKGKQIYYALQVKGKGGKGKHRWEGAKPGGTLAKARRTYMNKHKKKGFDAKTYEKMRHKIFGIKK